MKFALDQEVTVSYPAGPHSRRGLRRDGAVARRSTVKGKARYTVLFDRGDADVLIPEHWVEARGQMPLEPAAAT